MGTDFWLVAFGTLNQAMQYIRLPENHPACSAKTSPSPMKSAVTSTPGTIGYIDSADVDDSVKVLLTP